LWEVERVRSSADIEDLGDDALHRGEVVGRDMDAEMPRCGEIIGEPVLADPREISRQAIADPSRDA